MGKGTTKSWTHGHSKHFETLPGSSLLLTPAPREALHHDAGRSRFKVGSLGPGRRKWRKQAFVNNYRNYFTKLISCIFYYILLYIIIYTLLHNYIIITLWCGPTERSLRSQLSSAATWPSCRGLTAERAWVGECFLSRPSNACQNCAENEWLLPQW